MNRFAKLVAIAFAAMISFSVIGSEQKKQLESFCGITFGKRPLKKHTFMGRMEGGSRIYKFKPKKTFMKFNHYTYCASPISKTIYMVVLQKTFKDRNTCEADLKQITIAFEDKYKVKPRKYEAIMQERYLFDIDKTQIIISAKYGLSEHNISIFCINVPLIGMVESESKEYAIKNTDTSGL